MQIAANECTSTDAAVEAEAAYFVWLDTVRGPGDDSHDNVNTIVDADAVLAACPTSDAHAHAKRL